jgi:hypothetical protein
MYVCNALCNYACVYLCRLMYVHTYYVFYVRMYIFMYVKQKKHHAFLPTQPVFNNYLYTTNFNQLSIIRITIQELKMQGKSV